ncbi:hypothetical protein DYB28_002426 [Aphanomyces astaci]|uniref:DUF1279 domain-containing protein n=1 Tax=Aphanomyces astaci TaxID=112090 RepID=A0A9X8HCR1_APHAT|nr:hypothetical protein DYB28_002426 [Aphanomyces astaci]
MSFVPYITCYVQLLNLITRAGGGRGIWHATRAPLGKLNPDACRHISSGGKGWLAQHGEKLKQVTKEYGKVAVVFHSSVFIATLGAAYTSIRMGVDIRHVKVPFVNLEDVDPDAGSFFLAYLVTLATGTRDIYREREVSLLPTPSFICRSTPRCHHCHIDAVDCPIAPQVLEANVIRNVVFEFDG